MAKGRRYRDEAERTHALAQGAYLGTLRSEFDEPESIPTGFVQLMENVNLIVRAYLGHRIDARRAGELLAVQRAFDLNGGEWTIGANSGSWYRRQGSTKWMRVPAPSQAVGQPLPGSWQRPVDLPDDGAVSIDPAVEAARREAFEKELALHADAVAGSAGELAEAVNQVGPRTENLDALDELSPSDGPESSSGPVGGVHSLDIESYFRPATPPSSSDPDAGGEDAEGR